jgi:hypothetical protein
LAQFRSTAAAEHQLSRESALVLNDTIHRVRSVTFQSGEHVAVGVHGRRNAAVTQRFHHDPRRHPLCQEQARARVADVVEADPQEPCFIEKLVE